MYSFLSRLKSFSLILLSTFMKSCPDSVLIFFFSSFLGLSTFCIFLTSSSLSSSSSSSSSCKFYTMLLFLLLTIDSNSVWKSTPLSTRSYIYSMLRRLKKFKTAIFLSSMRPSRGKEKIPIRVITPIDIKLIRFTKSWF